MAAVFQSNVFQANVFQVGGTPGPVFQANVFQHSVFQTLSPIFGVCGEFVYARFPAVGVVYQYAPVQERTN